MRAGRTAVVLASGVLGACGGAVVASRRAAPLPPVRVSASTSASCRVTRPNGHTAPGERPSGMSYGEHGLWTLLPVDGVLRITDVSPLAPGETLGQIHADGSLTTKFPWWGSAAARDILRVYGRRFGGRGRFSRKFGPGARARSPHFWATRLTFAAPGCWQITARSGLRSLIFTTRVEQAHREQNG